MTAPKPLKPAPARNVSYDYCGIVFIGGGSSHAWAATPEAAAERAAKTCKSDWSSFYRFKRKQPFDVNVFDMRERDGWYADTHGVYDSRTREQIKALHVAKVIV